MEMERIGFLGLGAMGGPIATRMADWAQRNPGKRMLVFDPRAEAMQRATEAGAESGWHWALAVLLPLQVVCAPISKCPPLAARRCSALRWGLLRKALR